MVSLIAKSAFEAGEEEIGGVRLTPVEEGQVSSIAPFKGKEAQVSAVLSKAVGIGFPEVNTCAEAEGVRLVWMGRGKAHLIGAAPPDLAGLAAVADQSGAEAVLRVDGENAEDVLARLVPLDLRVSAFPVGSTARTQVAHMTASVSRLGDEAFELRVMRSMAGTLWHDVTRAARLLAERV